MIFYYDKDNKIYEKQWDAIASKKHCWFYYHDDVFRKANWNVEPSESLEQLYKLRAEEIRDTYEYVILCYSGGHDSTVILETFYYNNIHIDEILLIGSFSQDSFAGSDENHNAEIHINCFPLLRKLDLPNTKITVLDYTEKFKDPMNFSLIRKYGNEWIKYVGAYRSINYMYWHDLQDFVGQDKSKKTCYIMGVDKLMYSDGKFIISDLAVTGYGGPETFKRQNFDRVHFFTSPEPSAINIMRKQAHILKRIDDFHAKGMTDIKPVKFPAKNWEIDFENAIYNVKAPIIQYSPKSYSSCLSVRDVFMIKDLFRKDNVSDMHKFYKEGLQLLDKIIPIIAKPKYFTKPYYIESNYV